MRNRINSAFLATLITLAWMTCQTKGQTHPPVVSTLPPPFTLTYDLVVRHPNAKQQDEHLLNYKRQQYDWQVKQGTMTRQQAIQMLNAPANSPAPQQEHHRIVLSCNTKRRLLYQGSNEEDHTSNFVLYACKETHSFTLSSQQNIDELLCRAKFRLLEDGFLSVSRPEPTLCFAVEILRDSDKRARTYAASQGQSGTYESTNAEKTSCLTTKPSWKRR